MLAAEHPSEPLCAAPLPCVDVSRGFYKILLAAWVETRKHLVRLAGEGPVAPTQMLVDRTAHLMAMCLCFPPRGETLPADLPLRLLMRQSRDKPSHAVHAVV